MRLTIETRRRTWRVTIDRLNPEHDRPEHPQGDVFTDPQPGDLDARRPIGFWKGPTE